MPTTQKCECPGCNCQAAIGEKYCSTACADEKKTPGRPCQCNHKECNEIGLKM